MKAVIVGEQNISPLKVDFATEPTFSESWLQKTLFESPDLLNYLPSDALNPIIPLCRELPLRGASSTVFLDIFAVRKDGTPVLIECKLWRNPQARREVIGQILEYASLLHKRSYSDIEAQVIALSSRGIWQTINERSGIVSESSFIDRFTYCLAEGEFDLIIAGDGIRSDLMSITELLSRTSSNVGQLSLLEINTWKHNSEFFVVASPPIRFTKQQFSSTITDSATSASIDDEVSNSSNEQRSINRQFWDDFIRQVRFDHPDQEKPRHGGNNWVRMRFPSPAEWVTCYRTTAEFSRIGIFMTLKGDNGKEVYENLLTRAEDLRTELPGLGFDETRHEAPTVFLRKKVDIIDDSTRIQQMEWFTSMANKFVTVFRPILEDFSAQN